MAYHIIKGDTSYYRELGFRLLLNEEHENEKRKIDGIFWRLGNKWKYHIEKGDVCYIYYTNLPDLSNRILFRADVIDSDYENGKYRDKSICYYSENNDKYMLLKMRYIQLEDKNKYSKKRLIDKKGYNLGKINKMASHLLLDEIDNKKLIDDLKKENIRNHTLESITNYFENYRACFFGCKTFKKESGFNYTEKHHLIEKKLIDSNIHIDGLDILINDEKNLFPLCPMCHKKMHYIETKERRKMISKMYNETTEEQKELFDKIKNAVLNNKKIKTLEWLYQIYDCEDTVKESYLNICEKIYEKFNGYPKALLAMCKTKDEFEKNNKASLNNGNYIKLDNMYMSLNYPKDIRIDILNKLKKIYRSKNANK